jgi:DNA-directed RNA polymerase specialized sigma24 family protein
MQEGELVAAIAAGDPDGIAAGYDRYAASLYAYCHFRLSSQDAAAQAVLDTFAVATVKLDTLRDPDRLGPWLHAVARNECLRRLEPSGGVLPVTGPIPVAGPDGAGDDEPAAGLPGELRSQVLTVCTDPSPGAQAHRAALAERAGMFGPTGFPAAARSSGPRWWQPVRRHPRRAAAAATAVLAVTTGLTTLAMTGGSHPGRPASLAVGDGDMAATADAASSPGGPFSPGRTSSHLVTPPAAILTSSPTPASPASSETPKPAARASAVPSSAGEGTSPVSAAASSSLTPAPAVPALAGYLMVSPTKLVLTQVSGEAASGTFIITALNGPVSQYTVTVPKAMADEVTVSPASGSLTADGWVTVTVTVTSKAAVNTAVTVNPGSIGVSVLLSLTT